MSMNQAKHQLSTVSYPNNGSKKNGNGHGNGNGIHSPAASQSQTSVKNRIAQLADESPQIRLAAVKTLSEMGDPSAIEPLKALLRRETSTEVPETAIQHAIYSIEISAARARNRARQDLLRIKQEEHALRQRIAELDYGCGNVKAEQLKTELSTDTFKEGQIGVVARQQNGTGDIKKEIRFASYERPLNVMSGQELEELKVKIGELRRETRSSEVSTSGKTGAKKHYCSECQTRVRRVQMTCHYCGEKLLAGYLSPLVLALFIIALVALLLLYPTR